MDISITRIKKVANFFHNTEYGPRKARSLVNFKSKYVSTSISFSKFCELQQKWCVLAGSSATHSVCLGTHHQNMKSLLSSSNVTYQELIPLTVCDINNKECMVHRCPD